MTTETARMPGHLAIVGVIALLWNAFGCFDYLMTRTKGAPYIESMMPNMDGAAFMAYVDAFPIWASIGWGFGVWGGITASVLLLLRHRWAVPAFAVSLVGAVVGIGHQFATPADIPAMNQGANAVMPIIIIAIALGLFVYARAMRIKGVLR